MFDSVKVIRSQNLYPSIQNFVIFVGNRFKYEMYTINICIKKILNGRENFVQVIQLRKLRWLATEGNSLLIRMKFDCCYCLKSVIAVYIVHSISWDLLVIPPLAFCILNNTSLPTAFFLKSTQLQCPYS